MQEVLNNTQPELPIISLLDEERQFSLSSYDYVAKPETYQDGSTLQVSTKVTINILSKSIRSPLAILRLTHLAIQQEGRQKVEQVAASTKGKKGYSDQRRRSDRVRKPVLNAGDKERYDYFEQLVTHMRRSVSPELGYSSRNHPSSQLS